LLRAAETALDQVKQHGGNAFRCYAPELDSMAREFLEVESALHRALERDELFLVYQTQVELESRRESGREALLRWRHPTHGIVPPARFIPVAEETGLIGPIGAWASLEACRTAAGWGGHGERAPRVAVNVAARQLHDPRFCDGVAGMLAGTGLPAARLEIEITESTAMADPDAAAGTLNQAASRLTSSPTTTS
jgi:EAL domain-containing protein (putative c-di-GMP-specific phosphodiesterase class I)